MASSDTTDGTRRINPAENVDRMVGRSKAADVFRIMDAIGDGKPGEALSILEELFSEGEDPMAVMAPLTGQLRKLAAVARLHFLGKMPLGPAMDAAGVAKWDKMRVGVEKQMKYIGGRRLLKLTDWLVEINFGLKGGSALLERVQVERLIVTLARPREEAKRN